MGSSLCRPYKEYKFQLHFVLSNLQILGTQVIILPSVAWTWNVVASLFFGFELDGIISVKF